MAHHVHGPDPFFLNRQPWPIQLIAYGAALAFFIWLWYWYTYKR